MQWGGFRRCVWCCSTLTDRKHHHAVILLFTEDTLFHLRRTPHLSLALSTLRVTSLRLFTGDVITPCQFGVTTPSSGRLSHVIACRPEISGRHGGQLGRHVMSLHVVFFGPMVAPHGLYKKDAGGHIGAIFSPYHSLFE